jgi:tetratricopeptide (TPR) repeat protein
LIDKSDFRYSDSVFAGQVVLALALLQAADSADRQSNAIQQDIQAGKLRDAREKLQQAIRKTPQNAALWTRLGDVEVRLKDDKAAIAAFERVRSLMPGDAHTYFTLGLLYMEQGNTGRALEMYSRGLKLDPVDEAANQNYAFLLAQGGRPCEAVGPLQKLKDWKGADLSVRVSLIEAQLKCGNEEAGRRELEEFRQLPVEDQMKLAHVLVQDHFVEAAESTLEYVVRASPDLAEAHANLGSLLINKGEFEEAARQLGQAVQLAPTSPEFSMELAQVLLKAGQYPTALEFLKAVKDKFGALPEYQYKLAWSYYGLGLVPQAADQLQALAQQHPELDRVHYSLGNCYAALGRLAEAEIQYRQAIALNSNRGPYHSAIGQVLRKQGKVNDAALELERALELEPADLESRVQLAICYEQKAELPKAERLLEAAVQQQPNLLDAHRVLAQVYYGEGKKAQGDRESDLVSKLDSEETRRRAQMMDLSAPETFQ